MFLSIKVFEDLCASIFGKDLEKIRIPEIQQMIFIAVEVLGFLLSLCIPMFRMAEQF
jgi:hypothetical protein